MKKYITLTTIGLIAIIGTKAFAEGGAQGMKGKCHPGKVFVEDIDLTTEQETLVKELREIKKEKRGEMKGKRGERIETMVAFVEGELSREDVHQKITDRHTEKVEHISEMGETLFDLLDSYSTEQKEQVKSNLEDQKECMEEFKGKHAKKMKEMQGKDGKKGPGKRLFKDLDLTEEQQDLLTKIEESKKDFHKDFKPAHHEMVEDILDGRLDAAEAEESFLEKSSNRHVQAHSQADALMDLLETFSAEQKEQFVENVEQMKEKMNKRGGHRGPHSKDFEKE